MGIVYVSALVFGAGVLLGQTLMAGHDDGEVDCQHGHGELLADVEAEAEPSGSHGDAFSWLLTLRFWVYGALAFGLSGTLLHYLKLAGPVVTPLVAVAMGLFAGALASWVLGVLLRQSVSSGGTIADLVGRSGRVLIGVKPGSIGKVRVFVKGQAVDLLATTDDEGLDQGEEAFIVEVRGEQLHVARASTLLDGEPEP